MNWVAVGGAALALLLTVWAGLAFARLRERLPSAQYDRIPAQRWSEAQRAVLRGSTALAASWDFWRLSRGVTAAYVGQTPASRVASEAAGLAGVVSSPLPRLHLLSALVLNADDDPARIAEQPQVRQLLAGLAHGDFAHGLGRLIPAIAESYERFGISSDIAWELAYQPLAYPHGTFLQICTEQLADLSAQYDARGDAESALACRTLLAGLLRQWLIEPGPVGVRLVAADLLARLHESAWLQSAASPELVAALRGWRQAWRAAAVQRARARLIGLAGGLPAAPAEEQRAAAAIVQQSWLLLAAMLAGAIALPGVGKNSVERSSVPASSRGRRAGTPAPLDSFPSSPGLIWRWRGVEPALSDLMRGLVAAVVIIAAGLLVTSGDASLVRQDVRQGFPTETLWGRHSLLALLIAVVAIAVAALPGSGRWLFRVSRAGLGAWLVLALLAVGAGFWAEAARARYVAAVPSAYRAELSGVPEELVEALRAAPGAQISPAAAEEKHESG